MRSACHAATTLAGAFVLSLAASVANAQTPALSPPAESQPLSPLPAPPIDDNAPPAAFLQDARQALAAGRIGEAQEALERAETRALARSVRPSRADTPSDQDIIQQINKAREAVAAQDRLRALQAIDEALRNPDATSTAR